MPLYMDRHDVPGATAADVAQAHLADLEMSHKHDVTFVSYWFDESVGGVFCFAKAPSIENLKAVHDESHGLIPNEIIDVSEDDMLRFLGAINEPKDASEITSPVRTVVFTDLVGSTALLSQYGQDAYMALLAAHDSIVRKALIRHRGREVKHTGDGIMAAFDDVGHALSWGSDVLEEFAAREGEPAISVRVGMASGIPVDRNDDIYGETVVLASRICDAASSGQVLVSEAVHAAATGLSLEFDGPRPTSLKGFPGDVDVFELVTDAAAQPPATQDRPSSWWRRLTSRR